MMQKENKNEEGETEQFYREEGRENVKLKLAALFVVAVLVGVVIKAQAVKTITTGFDDYHLNEFKSGFDLNKKQEQVSTEQQTEGGVAETETEAPAPSCAQ